MTAPGNLMPASVAGGACGRPRRVGDALPGAETLADLLAFASRAADASPDVARMALLGWTAGAARGFPVAVVLRDAGADPERQRAVRRLVQAAIPTVEAGLDLVFYVVPAGHPQADAGVTLWPAAAVAAAGHGPR